MNVDATERREHVTSHTRDTRHVISAVITSLIPRSLVKSHLSDFLLTQTRTHFHLVRISPYSLLFY